MTCTYDIIMSRQLNTWRICIRIHKENIQCFASVTTEMQQLFVVIRTRTLLGQGPECFQIWPRPFCLQVLWKLFYRKTIIISMVYYICSWYSPTHQTDSCLYSQQLTAPFHMAVVSRSVQMGQSRYPRQGWGFSYYLFVRPSQRPEPTVPFESSWMGFHNTWKLQM